MQQSPREANSHLAGEEVASHGTRSLITIVTTDHLVTFRKKFLFYTVRSC
jgi:hypothetical protein